MQPVATRCQRTYSDTLRLHRAVLVGLRKGLSAHPHAPAGGTTVGGKEYAGGEFVPREGARAYWGSLSREERNARLARWTDRARPDLARWIGERVFNVDDAEDLLSDAVASAVATAPERFDPLQKREDLAGAGPEELAFRNWRSYLFQALRNRWKDHVRQESRKPEVLSFDRPPAGIPEGASLAETVATNPHEDPLDAAIRRFTLREVGHAIRTLREPYRGTAALHWLHGYSPKEIALGLSRTTGREVGLGTITSRLARARGELVQVLKDAFGEDVAHLPDAGRSRKPALPQRPAPTEPAPAPRKRGPKPGSHWRPEEERLREKAEKLRGRLRKALRVSIGR